MQARADRRASDCLSTLGAHQASSESNSLSLLGQLATDTSYAGTGIGVGLLKHALARSVEGARLVGGRALLVRAVDLNAREFWLKHGFLQTVDDPLMLFRSMADVAASLERASR